MSEITLPEGWLSIKISDVSDVQGGKRLPKGSEFAAQVTAHPYLRVTDFGGETVDVSNLKYIDDETFQQIKNYIISKNDLYISIAGTIGLVGDIPEQLDGANLTENAAKICNICGVDKIFLKKYLNSSVSQSQFEDKTVSSGQPKLALFRIRDCDFPLAPLAEQQQIAQKLDELLAQVDTLKTRLDAIPNILKRFRQSVLAAAVSGRLTEEWRRLYESEEWKICRLDDLTVEFVNGVSKRNSNDGRDTTILRLADFKDALRVYGNERKIKLTEKELTKYQLVNGDVLVIRVNGSVDLAGKFINYVPRNENEGFCDHFVRIRVDTKRLLAKYLTFIANDGEGRIYLQQGLSTSAGQNTINQGTLGGLKVPLPGIQEQTEIVRRVEQLFAYADQIEQRVKDAQSRVNHLTQSILAKAFRGELTADWRAQNPELISGENSAAALLERIRVEREAVGKPKRKVKA